jgi:hypothetical protein
MTLPGERFPRSEFNLPNRADLNPSGLSKS